MFDSKVRANVREVGISNLNFQKIESCAELCSFVPEKTFRKNQNLRKKFPKTKIISFFGKTKVVRDSTEGVPKRAVNRYLKLCTILGKNIFRKNSETPFCFFEKRKLVLGSTKYAQFCAGIENSKNQPVSEKKTIQKKLKNIFILEIFVKPKLYWVVPSEHNNSSLEHFSLRCIFSNIIKFFKS